MSKQETIRAIKNPGIRNLYPQVETVNPANAARDAFEFRNMKLMTRVKAGAPALSAARDRCTTTQ